MIEFLRVWCYVSGAFSAAVVLWAVCVFAKFFYLDCRDHCRELRCRRERARQAAERNLRA